MAPKRSTDRIDTLIADVEGLAERIRKDVVKRVRAAGLPKGLESTAKRLRKQAALVAAQVEKYAHQLRKDLEGRTAKPAHHAKARRRHAAAA